jgi:putative Ca2+/H+ antiporter (TMEM165/GDT1 family)
MGDKTQLLAFSLASRFRRPAVILAGILVATLANHTLASTVGVWFAAFIPQRVLAGVLAALFIAFGLWTLRPDTLEPQGRPSRFGPFLTTAVLFFLAEMGDKTQLATLALAARYHSVMLVTLGTTAGMLVADGLAVFAGDRLAGKVQARPLRWAAAALFLGFGLLSAWSAYSGR